MTDRRHIKIGDPGTDPFAIELSTDDGGVWLIDGRIPYGTFLDWGQVEELRRWLDEVTKG